MRYGVVMDPTNEFFIQKLRQKDDETDSAINFMDKLNWRNEFGIKLVTHSVTNNL